ncbi:unnamed protein product, partial [Brachionus calyciflorus]
KEILTQEKALIQNELDQQKINVEKLEIELFEHKKFTDVLKNQSEETSKLKDDL